MAVNISENAVRAALKNAGSVSGAAIILGVSRPTMYRLMLKYGIEFRRIVA